MTPLAPILTPQGRLYVEPDEAALAVADDVARRIMNAFARGRGHGLLQLGAGEVKTDLPPTFVYWREFGARYIAAVCTAPDADPRQAAAVPPLANAELDALVLSAPPMTGGEYLSATVLHELWDSLDAAFRTELAESKASVQDFLKEKNPA